MLCFASQRVFDRITDHGAFTRGEERNMREMKIGTGSNLVVAAAAGAGGGLGFSAAGRHGSRLRRRRGRHRRGGPVAYSRCDRLRTPKRSARPRAAAGSIDEGDAGRITSSDGRREIRRGFRSVRRGITVHTPTWKKISEFIVFLLSNCQQRSSSNTCGADRSGRADKADRARLHCRTSAPISVAANIFSGMLGT